MEVEFPCETDGCGLPLVIASIEGRPAFFHLRAREDDAGVNHIMHSLEGRNGCMKPATIHDGVPPPARTI